jgi:hypothetical protein
MLQRMLEIRFGELPAWAQEKVNAATTDELDQMAARFVTTSSTLEDVVPKNGAHPTPTKKARKPARR